MILFVSDNVIFDGIAAASITVTHQPPSGGAFLQVKVSGGTENTGSITINETETLTFTGADWQLTANDYTQITSITTTGFADEATKPTILITSVDIAGNPVSWESPYEYDVQFMHIPLQSSMVTKLSSEGLSSKTIVKVIVDWDIDIQTGQKFMIEHQAGMYIVWSEPKKKFQLGTDLVQATEFYGELVSPGESFTTYTEGELKPEFEFE
jgi:hypothetical protein